MVAVEHMFDNLKVTDRMSMDKLFMASEIRRYVHQVPQLLSSAVSHL